MEEDYVVNLPCRINKYIHPKIKEVVIQLCFWFKPEEIAGFLDMHPRTVQRIWKLYKETGAVTTQSDYSMGRPNTLDWTHGMVSYMVFILILELTYSILSTYTDYCNIDLT
jgi:hypothetical protein